MGTATIQGDVWSGLPHDWAELQAPLLTPIYEAVLKYGEVRGGQTLLAAARACFAISRLNKALRCLALMLLRG